jgi:hypothetical protein
MGQFGPNMNFLGIIQILTITFILKIDFYSLFLDFSIYWTRPQFPEKAGATAQNFLDTERYCADCGFNL